MSKLNNQAFSLQVRRGLRANLQKTTTYSYQGEPAYTTDTKRLYISDGTLFNPVATLDMAIVNNGDVVTHQDEMVYIF